jgi:threonine dehydrogenase-like Zn-dependent dehydrogenase
MPRRLAITGPFQVEMLEYEDPPLAPDQVLIRTELASGKHGTTTALFDNRVFEGQRFDTDMRLFIEDGTPDAGRQGATRENPWTLGTTGVGTVIAVGDQVTRFQPGDRVFGLMDVRETNIVPQDRLWPLGAIDPLLALCVEPAYVAFHCVRESNIRYGDTVVVVGLGALGLLSVLMARESGAEFIAAIDPFPNRRRLAAELGADAVFDSGSDLDIALEIHRLTGGPGVDVAIELTGVYPALNTAIRCVRVGGTVCSAGFYQGEAQGMWLGREWHHNRLTMIVPHGCGWGHPPRDVPRWDQGRAYEAIVSQMRRGRLNADSLITAVIPFEEGTRVFDWIRQRPNEIVKYAIRVSESAAP